MLRRPFHLRVLTVALLASYPAGNVLAADIDLNVAIGMAETVVSSLEAGQAASGLEAALTLHGYLKGEDSGDTGEGLAILQQMVRATRLYELSADSPDQSVIREVKLAERVFRSVAPGDRVRYPNGSTATPRFGPSHEWNFSNGARIAYRPTKDQEWKYSNGNRMVYRPTKDQEWKYPNGNRIVYRPTSDQEWKYANGAQIAYRPTNRQEWKYPNGRRICSKLGQPNQPWYYPDGTRWKDKGPSYSDGELSDVLKVITEILEDSGWGDRKEKAGRGPAAPLSAFAAPAPDTNPVARTLRGLESEMPDRLRFRRERTLGAGLGTVGTFLDSMQGARPRVDCYEEVDGYLAEVRGAAGTLRVRLDAAGSVAWETLQLARPLAGNQR